MAIVRPGEGTVPHAHDEHETFIVASGSGRMTIGDDASEMHSGDMIYIPPQTTHDFANLSDTEELRFITIWWKPSRKATATDVKEMVEAEFSPEVMMTMTSCAIPTKSTE